MTLTRRAASQPKEVTRELVADWEKRYPALKALNDATLEKPRGFCLSAAEARRLAGGEKELAKILPRWKRSILWLRGITVEYEHAAKGYRFLEVERHVTHRHERILKGQEKKHREEALRLALMRDGDMPTDHLRRLRVFQMNQHQDMAGKIESQREFARLALTQPETLPRLQGSA